MARFNMSQADNYGSNGSGSFFVLKDDRDTAKVRFLYNTIDDIEGYALHKVKLGDKDRYVNCLRNYNDPIDMCPLCQAQYKVVPRLFLKLYNEDAGECQIWERGKSYFQNMSSLASRYNPLCNEVVEIERNGKKGDKQTQYQFYPSENSEVNLDDYDCPEPLGTIILDKTAEEMLDYLNTGEFPESGEAPQPRANLQTPQRRTPSSNNAPRRAF